MGANLPGGERRSENPSRDEVSIPICVSKQGHNLKKQNKMAMFVSRLPVGMPRSEAGAVEDKSAVRSAKQRGMDLEEEPVD